MNGLFPCPASYVVHLLIFCHFRVGRILPQAFHCRCKERTMVLQDNSVSVDSVSPKANTLPRYSFETMYIDAVPNSMPSDSNICAPTLWHPDHLSLNNLFVSESPGPANLLGLIDWQHAAILPYISFQSLPPALSITATRLNRSPALYLLTSTN